MAFEDMTVMSNPMFQAVGNQLGLGGLFEQARNSPPPNPAAGKSSPNIPEYRNRPYIPRNEVPGQAHGGVGPGGTNPTTPGTFDPATLQNPIVQQLLAKYGVQPPTQAPDPNLFIHNPAAFDRHPVLAGMLERGMEGLAFAHPGTDALSSLIGGVRGIQEAQAARANQVNAQVMAPINQAEAIQKLLGTAAEQSQKHDLNAAQVAEADARAKYYGVEGQTKEERVAALPPRYGKDGRPSYAGFDASGHVVYSPDQSWQEDPLKHLQRLTLGAGLDSLIQKYGTDDKIPLDELQKLQLGMLSNESEGKSAGANEGKKIGAKATVDAATIRANATRDSATIRAHSGSGGGLDPHTKLEVSTLNVRRKQLQSELEKGSDMKSVLYDGTGNIIAAPSSRDAWMKERREGIKAIDTRLDQIYKGAGITNPAAPNTPSKSTGLKINRDANGRIIGIE